MGHHHETVDHRNPVQASGAAPDAVFSIAILPIVRMIPALCFPAQAIPDYLKDTRNRVYVKWRGSHIKLWFLPFEKTCGHTFSLPNPMHADIYFLKSTP
jgi:hypothetical protein